MANYSYTPFSDGKIKNGYQVNLNGDTFYGDTDRVNVGGFYGSLAVNPDNPSSATIDFGDQVIPNGFQPTFNDPILFGNKEIPSYVASAPTATTTQSQTEAVAPVATPKLDKYKNYRGWIGTALKDSRFDPTSLKNNPYILKQDGTLALSSAKLKQLGYTGNTDQALKEFLNANISDDDYSTLDSYFNSDPNLPYGLQRTAQAQAATAKTAQATEYMNRALVYDPTYSVATKTDSEIKAFVDGKDAAKKAEDDAKAQKEIDDAFEQGFQEVTNSAEPIWNYLITTGLDKLPDGGDRASELINKINNGSGTQADLSELNQIKASLDRTIQQQTTQTAINDAASQAQGNIVDYSGSTGKYDTGQGYVLDDGNYEVSSLINTPSATVADKINNVNFDPQGINTEKLNNVNTVDLSEIPKASVANATATQIDATNPAYKTTADKVVAGNALTGLIGQAKTNQIKVADNQLATKATQDLVNNSHTTNWNVDQNQLTSSNLTGMLSQNGRYLQDARMRGMRMANSRGMLNSSIAAGLAEEAAIAAAAPIAQADAKTYADSAQANAQADNTRLNKGLELNAGAISSDALTQFNAAKVNTDALNRTLEVDAQTYGKQAELDTQVSSDNARNKLTSDTNYASTLANLNAKNADNTTTVDIANKRAENEAETNYATNQTTALTNNANWQNQADLRAVELNAQDAWTNSELASKTDMFNAGEYSSALKFDTTNQEELKRLGIQLETDKNKTVAGWNVDNFRAKFQSFTQGERDSFLASNDFKKLFSAQNFELNKATAQTMFDVLRDDNSAEAQKSRDAILDTYSKENQKLADQGAMERTVFTGNLNFDSALLDNKLKGLNLASDVVKSIMHDYNISVDAIATMGDLPSNVRSQAIADKGQNLVEQVTFMDGLFQEFGVDGIGSLVMDTSNMSLSDTSTTQQSQPTSQGMISAAQNGTLPTATTASYTTQGMIDYIKGLSANQLNEIYPQLPENVKTGLINYAKQG